MNFLNWVNLYKILPQDLTDAFGYVKKRFQDLLVDLGWHGIAENSLGAGAASVSQSTPLAATVDVPANRLYTRQGNRIVVPTAQANFNPLVDEDGNAVALPTAGNERYITIFAKPKYVTSDSRLTTAAAAFDIRSEESFELGVEAGAIAAVGAATKPATRTNAVILCDILLQSGTGNFTNAANPDAPAAGEIDLRRAEYMEVRAKRLAVADFLRILSNLGGSKTNSDGARLYADLTPKAFFRVKWNGSAHVVAGKCNVASHTDITSSECTLTLPTGLFASADDIVALVTPEFELTEFVTEYGNSAVPEVSVAAKALTSTTVKVLVGGPLTGGFVPTELKDYVGYQVVIFGRPSI